MTFKQYYFSLKLLFLLDFLYIKYYIFCYYNENTCTQVLENRNYFLLQGINRNEITERIT